MKNKDKGLGKGLDALIKPDFYEDTSRTSDISSISINKIEPNINQPRSRFDEEKIQELSASIKKQGVLQPILVRKTGQGQFQIIAGERRWRASINAGMNTIPAIVREYSDAEALAIALIENLQREDLNIIEQAKALDQLKNELKINQEELADSIGKSRSHMANTLRLLNLPEEIRDRTLNNQISAGHARALLGLKDKDLMLDVADKIVSKKLSVRQTEDLIKSVNNPRIKVAGTSQDETVLADKVQTLVKEKINTEIKVRLKGNSEKGQLIIKYSNNNQFQDFMKILESQ